MSTPTLSRSRSARPAAGSGAAAPAPQPRTLLQDLLQTPLVFNIPADAIGEDTKKQILSCEVASPASPSGGGHAATRTMSSSSLSAMGTEHGELSTASSREDVDCELEVERFQKFVPLLWNGLTERLLYPVQTLPLLGDGLHQQLFEGSITTQQYIDVLASSTRNACSTSPPSPSSSSSPSLLDFALGELPASPSSAKLIDVIVVAFRSACFLANAPSQVSVVAIDGMVRTQLYELGAPGLYDSDSLAITSWWLALFLLYCAFAKSQIIARNSNGFSKAALADLSTATVIAVFLLSGVYLVRPPDDTTAATPLDVSPARCRDFVADMRSKLPSRRQRGHVASAAATPRWSTSDDGARNWFLRDFLLPLNSVTALTARYYVSLLDVLPPTLLRVLFGVVASKELRSVLLAGARSGNTPFTDADLQRLFKADTTYVQAPCIVRKYRKLEDVLLAFAELAQIDSPPSRLHYARHVGLLDCYAARLLHDLDEIIVCTPHVWNLCTAHHGLLADHVRAMRAECQRADHAALRRLVNQSLVVVRFVLAELRKIL